jgi:hypothetical protein
MVTKRTLEIIDQIVFYILVIVAIVIYFQVDRKWGLYMILIMIAVILLSYLPIAVRLMRKVKFGPVLAFCKKYDLVREDLIVKALKQDPEKLRKTLFEMSRVTDEGWKMLFIKRYYLFIREDIVSDARTRLKNKLAIKDSASSPIADLIKELGQLYAFETRAEIEPLIAQLREEEEFEKQNVIKKKE